MPQETKKLEVLECLNFAASRLKNCDLVVDVGCAFSSFLENFTEHALSLLNPKEVWGFEPIFFSSYEKLYEKDERVSLHKVALGSKEEEKMFFIPKHGNWEGLSSFYNRKIFARNIKTAKVRLFPLDHFTQTQTQQRRIDYLKIDTEGSEFEILKGAKNTLKKTNFVQIEHGGTYKDAGFTLQELCEFMKQNEFKLQLKLEKEVLFEKER